MWEWRSRGKRDTRPRSQFGRVWVSSLLDCVGLFYPFTSLNGYVQEVVTCLILKMRKQLGPCVDLNHSAAWLAYIPGGGQITQRVSSKRRPADPAGLSG